MAYHTKTIAERMRELFENMPQENPSVQEFIEKWCETAKKVWIVKHECEGTYTDDEPSVMGAGDGLAPMPERRNNSSYLVGIFSTKEKAEAFVATKDEWDRAEISEVNIDELEVK